MSASFLFDPVTADCENDEIRLLFQFKNSFFFLDILRHPCADLEGGGVSRPSLENEN